MDHQKIVSVFSQKVYSKLKEVPSGFVTTYGDLAAAVGGRAYRAVGSALNKNPYAPIVPCHRVVSSDGGIGGFAWGSERKVVMLASEGVSVEAGRIVDFEKIRWKFSGSSEEVSE